MKRNPELLRTHPGHPLQEYLLCWSVLGFGTHQLYVRDFNQHGQQRILIFLGEFVLIPQQVNGCFCCNEMNVQRLPGGRAFTCFYCEEPC